MTRLLKRHISDVILLNYGHGFGYDFSYDRPLGNGRGNCPEMFESQAPFLIETFGCGYYLRTGGGDDDDDDDDDDDFRGSGYGAAGSGGGKSSEARFIA